MIISQAHVTVKFFEKPFLRKYGLSTYNDRAKPVVFYGAYKATYKLINAHKAPCVILWRGGDSRRLSRNDNWINLIRDRKDIYHVACSSFISNDLKKCGIPHWIIPVVPNSNHDILPAPCGPNLYFYSSHETPDFYGEHLLYDIMRWHKGIKVIRRYAYPPGQSTRAELLNIYKTCFMGLRLTPHDGVANTVMEMGLMGRRCVWNGGSPNAIPWKNTMDIIEAIDREKSMNGKLNRSLCNEMKQYLDDKACFLNLNFFENGNSDYQYIPGR